MENNKFIKLGNNISFKPVTDGLEYSLEPGKIYSIEVDRMSDEIRLKLAPDFTMPTKVYEPEDISKFIDKVLNRYNKSENGTTGVMLSGLKGSGKTITAKLIAMKSNLPIILIDKDIRPYILPKIFNKLAGIEVCVVMDEIDKFGENYDSDYLLKIFDGINNTCKMLTICTCNNTDNVSEFMFDRCSRIRYWKHFDELSSSMIQNILEDKLNDASEVKPLTDFIIENFAVISFDNIAAFAEEINEYPKETFESLFEDMNLSSK